MFQSREMGKKKEDRPNRRVAWIRHDSRQPPTARTFYLVRALLMNFPRFREFSKFLAYFSARSHSIYIRLEDPREKTKRAQKISFNDDDEVKNHQTIAKCSLLLLFLLFSSAFLLNSHSHSLQKIIINLKASLWRLHRQFTNFSSYIFYCQNLRASSSLFRRTALNKQAWITIYITFFISYSLWVRDCVWLAAAAARKTRKNHQPCDPIKSSSTAQIDSTFHFIHTQISDLSVDAVWEVQGCQPASTFSMPNRLARFCILCLLQLPKIIVIFSRDTVEKSMN